MMFLLGLVVIVGIIVYYKWVFAYWKNRNLVTYEESAIPLGNAMELLSSKLVPGIFIKNVYDKLKDKGYKHAGAFAFFKPVYVVNDLDIIKTVLQRRFDHFSDRFYYVDETDHPSEANLVFVGGERWKYLRSKLSPAFTTGKMKSMLDIIVQCAYQMQKSVDSAKSEAIDIKNTASCYFMDITAASGFGLDINSFKDPNSVFIRFGRNLTDIKSKVKQIKLILKASFPEVSRRLGLTSFDLKSYDFFVNVVKDTVKFRKYNNVVRNDLLQLLLEAEPDLNVEEIDDESSKSAAIIQEMTGHALSFLLGGFETSSIAFTFCLLELARNSEIQDKLRAEIDFILLKHEGRITYEALADMKYMSQVVNETLRKYPPLPLLTRRCVKDCEIPDTGVVIEKGILVFISILGIHYDPDYYPDPERFDPERFSDDNKGTRAPFTYLPFGEGSRSCPAYRFGLMQIKVGLIILLQKYTMSLNKGTELPVQFDSGSFMFMPKTRIFLDIKNRKENI